MLPASAFLSGKVLLRPFLPLQRSIMLKWLQPSSAYDGPPIDTRMSISASIRITLLLWVPYEPVRVASSSDTTSVSYLFLLCRCSGTTLGKSSLFRGLPTLRNDLHVMSYVHSIMLLLPNPVFDRPGTTEPGGNFGLPPGTPHNHSLIASSLVHLKCST